MKDRIHQISQNIEVRDNLRWIKEQLKNNEEQRAFISEQRDLMLRFLEHEDAKVRRLSAQILAMSNPECMVDIYHAYEKEETLFVRPGYLEAIYQLDYQILLPLLEERLAGIDALCVEDTLRVHLKKEAALLYEMIVKYKGMTKHTFTRLKRECEVLLTTKPAFMDVTLKQLEGVPRKKVPQGVMVKTTDLTPLFDIRSYDELLFYIGKVAKDNKEPAGIAHFCKENALDKFIFEMHKEEHKMGFRIQYNGKLEEQRRGEVIRNLGFAIENEFGGKLFNTTTGYEVELRFIENTEGELFVFVKLYTINRKRFDYRKETVAASIKPYIAAGLMQIAYPYLKENAQILDPFCGVGTMLIERRMAVRAKDTYGIDIYGPAIQKAKINSEKIGEYIHFIHKNFKDFTHEYLFDEIVTNMPVMTNKTTRQEIVACYEILFAKAMELLCPGGMMILYGNEHGTVKRLLRLNKDFSLLLDKVVDRKQDVHLYVIKWTGKM